MTAITKERVEELRGALERWHGRLWNIHKWDNIDEWDRSGLSDILDDYSAMRAEIENRCDQRDAALESVGLLSAQLEKVKADFDEAVKITYDQQGDLEKYRPLIEVIMESAVDVDALGRSFFYETKQELAVLRAALKLREGEKK